MSTQFEHDDTLSLTAHIRFKRQEAIAFRSLDGQATKQKRIAAFIVVVAAVALNSFAPAGPTATERIYATLLLFLGFAPTYWWLGERRFTFPFLGLICMAYVVYYSVPIFMASHYYHDLFLPMSVPDTWVEEALLQGIVGLLAMIIGYYCLRRSWLERHVLQLRMVWEEQIGIEITAVGMGIVGLVFFYLRFLARMPPALDQIFRLLTDLSVISIAILFALQLKGKLRSGPLAFLWAILIPTRLMLGFGSGATFQGIEVVIYLIMVYAAVRQRLPMQTMGIALALLIVTVPLRGEFRARTWDSAEAALSPQEKAGIYLESLSTLLQGRGMSYSDALQTSVNRLSHLFTFAEVIQLTPSVVPYWMGETYYPLLAKPIPRFLWPNKPTEVTGQAFGHRYSFLGNGDNDTSYNLPLLVEWYANFGTIGVLFGMFFTGLCYRLIEHYLTYSVVGLGGITAGVYIMSRLLVIENSFSLVIGGIIWQVALLMALNYAMQIGGTGGIRAAD
jgi:hypothetical protein